MISAKLLKNLEKKGFELNIPNYKETEEEIIEIIIENNERLQLAIPLLLEQNINYNLIRSKLNKKEIKTLNKIILITNKIFELENLPNKNIENIIKNNKIKEKFTNNELNYYLTSFREFKKNQEKNKNEETKQQIENRLKLLKNKALSNIFSPAKIRIMEKIFNHQKLTNTELKYYYRGIKPLIETIEEKDMQEYLKLIKKTKKYT